MAFYRITVQHFKLTTIPQSVILTKIFKKSENHLEETQNLSTMVFLWFFFQSNISFQKAFTASKDLKSRIFV